MDPLITALMRPEAYDHPVGEIELLQTHISWVLLTGTYAYKIKKPVDLGFVDFSTLPRRRHFCREELRLNQRLSPDLYLGLRSIHGPPPQARFDGSGAVVEVAVMMHQFRQEDLLPALLRRPAPWSERLALIEDLADRLAAFHAVAACAPADSDYGTAARVQEPALANLAVLERLLGDDPRLPPLRDCCREQFQRLETVFEERRRLARVREGHGDLHLGNLVLHRGRIAAFDCLEFSAALRWIDVISDIAFLAMDLGRRRQPLLAMVLLDRWLSHSGDYGGLITWRWYVAYRALVRAKVTALQLHQSDGSPAARRRLWRADLRGYLHLAAAAGRHPDMPVLLITHGVSGSGKSHRARQLSRQLGWLHIRSDVERLRLFGRWGEPCGALLQGDPYAAAVSDRLYGDRLITCCTAALAAGLSLICDATFLLRDQRHRFRSLARQHGARFAILPCCCAPELAQRRIVERMQQGNDPSEADPEVLRRQLQRIEPLDRQEQELALMLPPGLAAAATEEQNATAVRSTDLSGSDQVAEQAAERWLLKQLQLLQAGSGRWM